MQLAISLISVMVQRFSFVYFRAFEIKGERVVVFLSNGCGKSVI